MRRRYARARTWLAASDDPHGRLLVALRSPRLRCAAGFGNVDLYTATRHYFGWYAWNLLELDARDIALHFGHQDGGELVRKLYGHPDAELARERVREAFRQAPPAPVPLTATLIGG